MSINVQGILGLVSKSDHVYHLLTYLPGYRIEDHSHIPEGALPCRKHHSESFSTSHPTPGLFEDILFNVFYCVWMNVCFMYVCAPHVCLLPQEVSVGSPKIWVMDCMSHHIGLPLEEQLSTTELSLQLLATPTPFKYRKFYPKKNIDVFFEQWLLICLEIVKEESMPGKLSWQELRKVRVFRITI